MQSQLFGLSRQTQADVSYLPRQERPEQVLRSLIEKSGRLQVSAFEKSQFIELRSLDLQDFALPLELLLDILHVCPNLKKIYIDDDALVIFDTVEAAFASITAGKGAEVQNLFGSSLEVAVYEKDEVCLLKEMFRKQFEQYLEKLKKPDDLLAFLKAFLESQPADFCDEFLNKIANDNCALLSSFSGDQLAKLIIFLAKQKWSFFTPERNFSLISKLHEMDGNGRKKIYAMRTYLLKELFQALFEIASYTDALLQNVSNMLMQRERAEFVANAEAFAKLLGAGSQKQEAKPTGPQIMVGGMQSFTNTMIAQQALKDAGLLEEA